MSMPFVSLADSMSFQGIIFKILAHFMTINAFVFWIQQFLTNLILIPSIIPSIITNFSLIVLFDFFIVLCKIFLIFLILSESFLRRVPGNSKLIGILENESKNVSNFLFEPMLVIIHYEFTQAMFQFHLGNGIDHFSLKNMTHDIMNAFFKRALFSLIFKFIKLFVNLYLLLITFSQLHYLCYMFYLYGIFLPLTFYLYIFPLVVYFFSTKTYNIVEARDRVLTIFQKINGTKNICKVKR